MFVTLEGMEGAGKSTLQKGLAEQLAAMGHCVHMTREPGGCALGKTLRHILLDTASDVNPEAELFLFLADRAQHVHEGIRPALAAKNIVLCDRFADSTIVYQGYGRGFDVDLLQRLNNLAIGGLWPDMTFIVDVPPHTGLDRARSRNAAAGLTSDEGRFEAEDLAFHTRIRDGFLDWASRNAKRCTVLDGTLPPEALLQNAMQVLRTRIQTKQDR